MQLAISTYSLARWRRENNKTLEQSLDWIADAGVNAVEFAGLDDHAAENPTRRARALRKRCEKLGLRIVGYCARAELFVPPPKQRLAVEQLKAHVQFAAELGTPWMRHDVTTGPPAPSSRSRKQQPSLDQVITAVVPPIRSVADFAATLNIKTSVENHGYYMQPSDTVRRLLRAVDHPNFGLTLDMGNFMVVGEDPVSAVKKLARFAGMVHVKDFHQHIYDAPPAGWFRTTVPHLYLRGAIVGHGEIDIPAQLSILRKSNYSGYVSIEFEGIEEPTMAIKSGLEYLAACGFALSKR